jgi:hypothetical protein
MINPKELRIGNWFTNERDEPERVYEISDDAVNGFKFKVRDGNPIELTPALLEKLGFTFKNEDEYHIRLGGSCNYLVITISDNSFGVYDNDDNYAKGNYIASSRRDLKLHNLQNLIYELTGKEYEFTDDFKP